MTEPTAILEEALRHSNLNEPAKESLRQRMEAAQINAVMAGARARVEHERLVGGTYGETDVPREPGSKHARPEGLSAGARYLRGGA